LASLTLRLAYRPPLAWNALIGFLGHRTIAGVEATEGDSYLRTAAIGPARGWIKVRPLAAQPALAVEFSTTLAPVLPKLLARLRHLFDLNARPDLIAEHLGNDPHIGASVRARPGLRVPGAFSGFEMAWRAVLGQRISVAAATTLARRLTAEFGEPIETPFPELCRLSPTPGRIAGAEVGELARLGISTDRANTIRTIAREMAANRLRLEPGADPERTIEQLRQLPGIGEWTAHAIAMRALAWPDAFPTGDLGLLRGLGETSTARLRNVAEAWRPWRSYAAIHVWNGLLPQPTREPR
jgi:AraC family transcriptional regulator of adaptative response / DNA-3-methyladenine glycosylase II